MSRNTLLAAICVLAAAIGQALPAAATPVEDIFTLGTYAGTGSPAAGPYGTVILLQNGANVEVQVSLNALSSSVSLSGVALPACEGGHATCGFVNTGAGDALDFDLTNVSTLTLLPGSLTSGFSLASASPGSYVNGAAGSFNFAIKCSTI